jgi:hypothetical protein
MPTSLPGTFLLGKRPIVPLLLLLLLLLGPALFSYWSFRVHHPVNRDDRNLLTHAMASDFSATWQFLSKRKIGFLLQIKLRATVGKRSLIQLRTL